MSKLLTTLQVRTIMRANGVTGSMMYTNKTAKHTGNIRRVKCYLSGADAGYATQLPFRSLKGGAVIGLGD